MTTAAPAHRTPPASDATRTAPSPSRRALLLSAAALAPTLAFAATTAPAHAATGTFDRASYRNAAGLTMVDGSPWTHPDERSIDFRVRTGLVKTFPPSFRVTLPRDYDKNADRRWPVLLLLHGQGGYFLDWSEQGNAVDATAPHDVITVAPDGGSGSFYINANFPLPGREAAWESFIMTQVLPFVHANFRTDATRMAIAGLSMGGWGALSLGQRYYGHFRSVSSYSGPGDCNPASADGLGVAGAIWLCPAAEAQKYPLTSNPVGATWGSALFDHNALKRSYNPIDNIERYRDKRVFLRTGTGPWLEEIEGQPVLRRKLEKKMGDAFADTVETAVFPNMQRFAAALDKAGIPRDFTVVDGANHEWGLWADSLRKDLPGMVEAISR